MSAVFYYEPFCDLDRAFDEALNRQWNNHQMQPVQRRDSGTSNMEGVVRAFKPRMDLHEDSTRNIVTVTFELPGIKRDHIQLDVHNGQLTVSAESTLSTQLDERGYTVRERRYGTFSRMLRLPPGVDESDIGVKMANGLLTITFPKFAPKQESNFS